MGFRSVSMGLLWDFGIGVGWETVLEYRNKDSVLWSNNLLHFWENWY